jgi:hypothetical protein
MRSLLAVLIISALVIVGCQANEAAQPDMSGIVATVPRTPHNTTQTSTISLTVDDVELSIERPAEWQFYATDYGIVLAEALGSVATDGRLAGLLAHIFVPPLNDVDLLISDAENLAWAILSEIVRQPEYVGSALVSEPVAFTWSGHSAAYYLVDNEEGHLTIVIGVTPADSARLVACSISAPVDQSQRMRESLAGLLDHLRINGAALDGSELEAALPPVLEFPQRSVAAD